MASRDSGGLTWRGEERCGVLCVFSGELFSFWKNYRVVTRAEKEAGAKTGPGSSAGYAACRFNPVLRPPDRAPHLIVQVVRHARGRVALPLPIPFPVLAAHAKVVAAAARLPPQPHPPPLGRLSPFARGRIPPELYAVFLIHGVKAVPSSEPPPRYV